MRLSTLAIDTVKEIVADDDADEAKNDRMRRSSIAPVVSVSVSVNMSEARA